MKRMMRALAMGVLMVACWSATAVAAPDDMDRPPTREQMEKVRQRIETLRIWRLTKALDLDEKTSAALFPVLNKYDRKRHELEQSLRNSMRELREAGKEGREPVLKGLLERLDQNHREMQKVNEEERGEVKRILNVKQQAAFVLFQQDFQQEIRRIIEESRGRKVDRRVERPDEKRPPWPLPPARE